MLPGGMGWLSCVDDKQGWCILTCNQRVTSSLQATGRHTASSHVLGDRAHVQIAAAATSAGRGRGRQRGSLRALLSRLLGRAQAPAGLSNLKLNFSNHPPPPETTQNN